MLQPQNPQNPNVTTQSLTGPTKSKNSDGEQPPDRPGHPRDKSANNPPTMVGCRAPGRILTSWVAVLQARIVLNARAFDARERQVVGRAARSLELLPLLLVLLSHGRRAGATSHARVSLKHEATVHLRSLLQDGFKNGRPQSKPRLTSFPRSGSACCRQ